MSNVPPGMLNKPKNKIRLSNIAILLFNVDRGARTPSVGFEDANRTLETLIKQLDREAYVYRSALESALWSCNLLNEKEKFWHPEGKTFDEFVKDVLGNVKFDKTYNMVEGSTE